MRFNLALLVTIALSCGSLRAATPAGAFEANRDSVLSGKCVEADGVMFGIGVARPRSDSSASRLAAREKARLAAKANLIARKVICGIVWPDNVDIDRRREIVEKVVPFVSAKATVKGLESVYSNSEPDGQATAVVAAPIDGVAGIGTITYADAMKFFEASQRRLQARAQQGKSEDQKNDTVEDAVVDSAVQAKFLLPNGAVASENETIGF